MDAGRYRTLLLDLDGVLRRWPVQDLDLEGECGLPQGAIREAAFESSLLEKAVTGVLRDEEWREEAARRLQRSYPEADCREAVRRWSLPVGEIDLEVLTLCQGLHSRVRLTLVTNATTRLSTDLEALGVQPLFYAIVNSSEVGHAKPSPEIFRRALEMVDANVEDSLFIDDSPLNVEAAEALGITSHLFTEAGSMRVWLQNRAVLG